MMEIIDALETAGYDRYDYQLNDVVDVEALERLLTSATGHVEVSFTIHDAKVTVNSDRVTVTCCS